MFKNFRGYGLAALLAMGSFTFASDAQAHDRRYHRGDGDAAAIIGAGIVGLAVGALIADSNDRHYYDRDYYRYRRYVTVSGYPGYYYYYDRNPGRYYRDRYYNRHYGRSYDRRYYDRRHYNRWERGYNGRRDHRWTRGYERRHWRD